MSETNDYSIFNSLSSPADMPLTTRKSKGVQQLSDEMTALAMEDLNNKSLTEKYKKREVFLVDPNIPHDQRFSLISFLPSKNAQPDQDGVYGMLKVRGTFETEEKTTARARFLIQNVDSYHDMYHVFTGEPVPLTRNNSRYIKETVEVDIKKKNVEINSQEIRLKRDEENSEIKEIHERQQKLLADVNENKPEDPTERYTELLTKKAQLTWTYNDNMSKLEIVKKNIIKAREEIARMDQENPAYREESLQRFRKARREAHIPDDDKSFIKYLVEDLDLGF